MTDAERVAAIERKAELRLLERLLAERERSVPPAPPRATPFDPTLRQHLMDLMLLIARSYPPETRGGQVSNVVPLRPCATKSSSSVA